jgi:4-amino-4-deoxy-L-arabinose transferase-like glycosyltransferase
MTDMAGARAQKFLPLWLLQAVTLYWIALKVAALFIGEPHADEAYYWVWGRHLELSYFDHAPLHAWLQGLMGLVFGTTLFGLRFLSLITAAITLYVLYLWARRLAPRNWRDYFWTSAALFYSTPLLLFYTTIAVHDRLLVALGLCAIHCFAWFFADWEEGKRDRLRWLYLGALFIGLATLSKYNGALIGIGVALVIVIRRDLRPLFANPHLYVAAGLSVLMQFPTLYWNFVHGFPSVQFHLGRAVSPFDLSAMGTGNFTPLLFESLIVLGPVTFVGICLFLLRRARDGFAGVLHATSKWIFIASSVFTLGLALTRPVLFYWNDIAYAAFFGVAAIFLRSRLLQALQLAYGLLLGTILLVHFSIYPVLHAVGIASPQVTGMYGWPEIAERVSVAQERYDAAFAAGPSWGTASRLSFALGGVDVPAINPDTDALDFWTDPERHRGADAIVLVQPRDDQGKLAYLRSQFGSFEAIDAFTIERFGLPLEPYSLYLGRDYRPD